MARFTKGLTKSRSKKACSLADYEEKYLTLDEEAKADPTRRKANKLKAMSRFNEELRWKAEDEVQLVRELSTEEAQKIREQNTKRFAERSAELAPEEGIQAL